MCWPQDYEACLLDCDGALRGRSDCKDAWITRARCVRARARVSGAWLDYPRQVRSPRLAPGGRPAPGARP
jgi:hypothetical protein